MDLYATLPQFRGETSLRSEIPGSLWNRPEMVTALRSRAMGRVLQLVRQHAGLSQTAIGSLIGMSQGKVSGIMAGSQHVTTLEVYERIADGLQLPDSARTTLGLAPRHIPAGDGSASGSPGTLRPARSVERDRRPEEDNAVRRREFVGLTGAGLFGAIMASADTAPAPATGSTLNDLATVLTEHPAAPAGPTDLTRLSATVAAAKRDYQACKYGDVLNKLPPLLRSLRAASVAVDVPTLEEQTGRPVRSQYRKPGEPRSPRADAIIVAPATYNTINKFANGISDTYALGLLAEAPGLGIPIVILPFVNSALASRAPFSQSVEQLRAEGIRILFGPGGCKASGATFGTFLSGSPLNSWSARRRRPPWRVLSPALGSLTCRCPR
jgi:transcriptional regulator with XRE-family HTH domain